MTKTGAVYFLYRFFNDNPEATIEEGYDVYKQALEMEKEQIIEFADEYGTYLIKGGTMSATSYNETYGSK